MFKCLTKGRILRIIDISFTLFRGIYGGELSIRFTINRTGLFGVYSHPFKDGLVRRSDVAKRRSVSQSAVNKAVRALSFLHKNNRARHGLGGGNDDFRGF